jgi:hypothetical protein
MMLGDRLLSQEKELTGLLLNNLLGDHLFKKDSKLESQGRMLREEPSRTDMLCCTIKTVMRPTSHFTE